VIASVLCVPHPVDLDMFYVNKIAAGVTLSAGVQRFQPTSVHSFSHGAKMYEKNALDTARLIAAAQANSADARMWRWYADAMEERRLRCQWKDRYWVVTLDGRNISSDQSFDSALRAAQIMDSALVGLQRA
jgi:hypothetical protein